MKISNHIDQVWVANLARIMETGHCAHPSSFSAAEAGSKTLELINNTICIDMRNPLLSIPERAMNYRFAVAEAMHIISGDNRVESIIPYCKAVAKYSDDGMTFDGAYGPMVNSQLDYVVDCLLSDVWSRQAAFTIWKPNPRKSKDIPCTLAASALIRNNNLHLSVYMRSSDAWMGLVYDLFSFSMIGHLICSSYNEKKGASFENPVKPGMLFVTATSSHIYARDLDIAREVVATYQGGVSIHNESRHYNEVFVFDKLKTRPELWACSYVSLFDHLRDARDIHAPVTYNVVADKLLVKG